MLINFILLDSGKGQLLYHYGSVISIIQTERVNLSNHATGPEVSEMTLF